MNTKIKIIGGMAAALLLTFILSKTILTPFSPKIINKNYFYALYDRIFSKPTIHKNVVQTQFQNLGNGVYASENKLNTIIRIEDTSLWKRTIVEYKGKRILIQSPYY